MPNLEFDQSISADQREALVKIINELDQKLLEMSSRYDHLDLLNCLRNLFINKSVMVFGQEATAQMLRDTADQLGRVVKAQRQMRRRQ